MTRTLSLLFSVALLSCRLGLAQTDNFIQLIQPGDFEYKGAFRLPLTPGDVSSWGYGGHGLTYYPVGDTSGPNDGYSGSLFGTSHFYQKLVSEISIPVPVISTTKNATQLNVAATLQQFGDITGGLKDRVAALGHLDAVRLGYLPQQGGQATGKIYWSLSRYYPADGLDHPSIGWAEPSVLNPQAKGLWRVGPYHSVGTSGYLFEIPRSWADINVPGKYLASGRHQEGGCCGSGAGPSIYAMGLWNDENSPSDGSTLEAKQLLNYPDLPPSFVAQYDPRLPSGPRNFPGYQACDEWTGGTWLTVGGKSAVIIVGRKSLGETYYGDGRPSDSEKSRGYHCDQYEPQFLFYNPDDLAQVAKGQKQPWEVLPYAILRPTQYFWPEPAWHLGEAAFDRARGLLYVVQRYADNQDGRNAFPLIHVFSIRGS
jgi:hypothetical protein